LENTINLIPSSHIPRFTSIITNSSILHNPIQSIVPNPHLRSPSTPSPTLSSSPQNPYRISSSTTNLQELCTMSTLLLLPSCSSSLSLQLGTFTFTPRPIVTNV